MKCPNCSFENSDELTACKVCGFELIQEKRPPSPARKRFEETEEELDSSLDSLFGLDDEPEVIDVSLTEKIDDKNEDPNKSPRNTYIIILFAVLLVILLIFLKSSWSSMPWKYKSTNETNATESSVNVTTYPSTEFPVVMSESMGPINQFYLLLPDFVNSGNLSILGLFSSPQEALDILTNLSSIGTYDKLTLSEINNSNILESEATFSIYTEVDRTKDGTAFSNKTNWDFRVVLVDNEWKIDSFSTDVIGSTTGNTTGTTQSTTSNSTTATTESTTTPPTVLEGFIASGSFSGGSPVENQDISSARYGLHDGYERIVFDVSKWTSSANASPTETNNAIGPYTATISNDGQSITILFSDTASASASRTKIEYKADGNIESIEYFYPSDNSTVGILINLKTKSMFKVFPLKEPARLVIDIAGN